MRVPFRGVTTREVALVEGPAGWGEFGPFLEYEPSGGVPMARRCGRVGVAVVAGARARASCRSTRRCPRCGPSRSPRCSPASRGARRPRSRWPSAASPSTTTSPGWPRSVSVLGPSARGCASTPTGRGRSTTPCDALARLARHDLEYAEQPCATVEELRDLRIALARNGVDVLVAADESIRKAEDPLRVRDLGAADVVVVKVAPLGGVRVRPRRRGGLRSSRRRVVRARHERRHLGRRRARGRTALARARLWPRHGGPARR